MSLENLDIWADDKGVNVIGTGDFTYPAWIREIKNKLELAESGLFKLKKDFKKKTIKGTVADTRFMLTTEISNIYSRGGKTRRVHNLIFVPDIATAEKINKELGRLGNLKSDGRPILGLDSEEMLKIILEANPKAAVIPAHAWTPWFSVFGSMSGFDSLEECYGDLVKHIFAIETGLSSDPAMNWRVSALDKIALISNSDAHSLEKIGREANVLECEMSYEGIMGAIKSGAAQFEKEEKQQFLSTIEFFPEEGKYHLDGHRSCGVVWTPAETKKHKNICSKCGSKVTVGVLSRVRDLADRPEGFFDARRPSARNLISLDKIIGEALGVGAKTKTVKKEYDKLIIEFGSELGVLIGAEHARIAATVDPRIAEGIIAARTRRLKIRPGYDGEYGEITIF